MRLTAWALLALALTPVSAQQIYRFVAEDGTVTYSDVPAPNAESVTVDFIPAPPTSSAVRLGRRPDDGTDDDGSDASGDDSDDEGSGMTPAERAEQQCELARERVATYQRATRLYRTLPDGEREFLTDDEIAATRTQAQQELDQWCN